MSRQADKLQRVQLQKNLAMIGGMIFAVLDARPTTTSVPAERVVANNTADAVA
ncbi:hypothetical protein ACWF99_12335 [Nocardia sp. NPDC055002]